MKFNFNNIDCPTNCGGLSSVIFSTLSPYSKRFGKRITVETLKYNCVLCGFSFTTDEIDNINHRNYRSVVNMEERKIKINRIWK